MKNSGTRGKKPLSLMRKKRKTGIPNKNKHPQAVMMRIKAIIKIIRPYSTEL
jgi:hypothetical protein